MNSITRPIPWWRRWAWRMAKAAALVFGSYLGIVLLGLFPLNNDYEPPSEGIEIFVVSNEVHADLILPLVTEIVDWRRCFPAAHFSGNVQQAKYVLIGWGDRGFFIETPTWGDLKLSTAANALLWPSETAMHVTMTEFEGWDEYGVRVRLTAAQYRELVEFVRASFADSTASADPAESPSPWLTQPAECRIDGTSYGKWDAFYRAHGQYHCLNTCNSWIGRALRVAGVRAGAWTPLPKSVYLYLPKIEAATTPSSEDPIQRVSADDRP